MAPAEKNGTSADAHLEPLRQARLKGPRHGPGKALAVVAVDLQNFFVPTSDPVAVACVESAARLLGLARKRGVPVFLSAVVIDHPAQINLTWAARFDLSPFSRGRRDAELHPLIGPRAGDVVVEKLHASCFFGTALNSQMRQLGVDTILLCGATTSGCVRATAVDGAGLGFRMELVEECSYEPRPLSGPVALSEIHDRYADVISLEEAVRQIETIARGADGA